MQKVQMVASPWTFSLFSQPFMFLKIIITHLFMHVITVE